MGDGFTFEANGFEVIEPAEPLVRVELTKTQLSSIMDELRGKGTFNGAWMTLRDAASAVGASW